MSYDFSRIKKQLKPRDDVVNDTIKRSKQIKPSKPIFTKGLLSIASVVCVLLVCCLAIPVILKVTNTPVNPVGIEGTDKSIEQQPEEAMAFNEGVTISPALSELLKNADQDEVFSVRIKIINLTEAYENEYSSELYDGKTYESWWQEYESINARMIEIDGILKDGADAELEAEYNECVERSEAINLLLSEIARKQRSASMQKEIAYFKTLGIDTAYKGGYLTAELNIKQIQSITKEGCDYLIDTTSEKDLVEDMH